MSENIFQELEQFLNSAGLTNYEASVFLELLRSKELTAREISERSKVPSGRIYEILELLKQKGMIEIQDTRPKKYISLEFNPALENLLLFINERNKEKFTFLANQAKNIESRIYDMNLFIKKENSKRFLSTTYGAFPILTLYIKKFKELREELLISGFLNKSTSKVLPKAKIFYQEIFKAVKRGVKVKYLWSFEFDNRALSSQITKSNRQLYILLRKNLSDLYGLNEDLEGFDLKFINKRITTLFDIFDNKRVLMKLQNPVEPTQIFACINVLDPKLAKSLKEKYMNLWSFEASD
jgi:sugar-specific transcriptional regulator TrmB